MGRWSTDSKGWQLVTQQYPGMDAVYICVYPKDDMNNGFPLQTTKNCPKGKTLEWLEDSLHKKWMGIKKVTKRKNQDV